MLFCLGKHILWIPRKIILVSSANYFSRLDVILCTCEILHLSMNMGMNNNYFSVCSNSLLQFVYQVLWANCTFFIKLETDRAKSSDVHLGRKRVPTSSKVPGVGATGLSPFEAQLEVSHRVSDVKKMILGERTI